MTAQRSHKPIRLPNGSTCPVMGVYEAARPIRYRTEDGKNGKNPKVVVEVPTNLASHSYTTFTFDAWSGEIVGLGFGSIHYY